MKSQTKNSIIVLLVFVIVSGCNLEIGNHPTEATTPSVIETEVAFATSTFAQSSAAAMPTTFPTMTLVPVLSAHEAEAGILEILKDNGGCQLPCFWGFTPGESSMQEYLSFINAYSRISPSGGPGAIVPLDAYTIMVISPVFTRYQEPQNPETIRRVLVDMAMHQGNEYGDYIFSNSLFTEYTRYYSLPYLLDDYGSPPKVLIQVEHDMGLHDFYLYLDYADQGWSAMFRMPLEGNDANFVGCPDQSLITLWLWAPEDIESATRYGYFLPEINIFTTLEEATSLTLDEFYQQFKDPENTQCLETPKDIWTP